jgi:hypothetical protein
MVTTISKLMNAAEASRQQAQGLVEYGLIIALVSVAAVAALNTLSGDVNAVFTGIGATLNP